MCVEAEGAGISVEHGCLCGCVPLAGEELHTDELEEGGHGAEGVCFCGGVSFAAVVIDVASEGEAGEGRAVQDAHKCAGAQDVAGDVCAQVCSHVRLRYRVAAVVIFGVALELS